MTKYLFKNKFFSVFFFFFYMLTFLTFSEEDDFLKKNHFIVKENKILKDLQRNLPYKLNDYIQEYIVLKDYNDRIHEYPLENSEGVEMNYFHLGVDFFSYNFRSEIYPASSGIIEDVGYDGIELGMYVVVKHSANIFTVYGHLSGKPIVKKGDSVTRNTLIGYSGNTGTVSTGMPSIIHYGIIINNQYVNPLKVLDRDMWEHIQFHENYQPRQNSIQYEPKNLKKLKLTQDKLLYTSWGPEGGGVGLYLEFYKNYTYSVWDNLGTIFYGKYEINENNLLLIPDEKSASYADGYKQFQKPQQYEYIYDSNNLINGIKLNHKLYDDFYNLNSKPDMIKVKKIGDIYVLSTGSIEGIITRDVYIRTYPKEDAEYYLIEKDTRGFSPYLKSGSKILIFAKTVEEYTVNGKKCYWYYCRFNSGTFLQVIVNSDKDKKDISYTNYRGWIFSEDIELVAK